MKRARFFSSSEISGMAYFFCLVLVFFGIVPAVAQSQAFKQANTDTLVVGTNRLSDEPTATEVAISSEWLWVSHSGPFGDLEIDKVIIDQQFDTTWYVTSWNGVYITRDSGNSWEQHLSG